MAYFEQIKQSKTWVCPKSGYYKIVCVGGGGGGGGAGYYSPGVTNPSTSSVAIHTMSTNGAYDLSIPYFSAYYNSSYESIKSFGKLEYNFAQIFKNFFKEGVKFVSSCSGGSQGGSGGSTSFGNILTAVGGAGGAGGGANYGSAIKKSFLSPQGGNSITSPGGSGASLTSCYTSEGYLKMPYLTTIAERECNFNDCPEYRPLKPLILPYNFGIDGVSACSGAGGAGGDIETIITFIEKGTEIPCAIGAGGAGGNSGSVQINNQIEYPSVSINTSVSGTHLEAKVFSKNFHVDGRPEWSSGFNNYYYAHSLNGEKDVGSNSDYIHVTIPFYTPFRLEASIPGGGGGGGFTLTQSGGVGSSLDVSNSCKTLNGEIALPFVDSTIVERRTHSLNGGEPNCNGVGYGAGGAGGNNVTKFCLGTDKSNEEVAYVQKTEGGSTSVYAQYTGAITLPIVDFSGFPRTLEPSSGNAGVDGYICIQEVS